MKAVFASVLLMAVGSISAAAPVCGTPLGVACCKICHAGKACGDTCIARDKECHKGRGCACDG